MLREDKELYEFDKFRLDVSERFLLRNGKRVALADRAFDTLCVLVRRGNQLVSKDELMTEVWADAIVEENNLDKNISALRRILGERNGRQTFIETVRGHGYRFVAEVRRVDGDTATWKPGDADAIKSESPAPMGGLDLSEPPAVAGGFSEVESQESSVESDLESQVSNQNFQNPEINRTKDEGQKTKPAIANRQSGNVVALAAWRHEASADDAGIAEPATNEFQKETILKAATSDVTPKIKSNKFRRAALAICALPVTAGIGYALYKFADPSPMIFEAKKTTRITATGKVKLAAISPDGKLIVYAQEENGEQQSLWIRHITSESSVQIAPSAQVEYRGLNISPDGNWLYYVVGQGSLYQMPVLSYASKKIADGLYTINSANTDVGISPDGKQIAFVRRFEKQSSALFLINADGTNERTLAAFEQPIRLGESVNWSPDGKVIVCRELINGLQNVLAVQISDVTSAPILPQNIMSIMQIAWMPDSKSLLTYDINGRIYQILYPSGEMRQINVDRGKFKVMSLTSDGRFLAMVKTEKAAYIWMMPGDDVSRVKQLTAGFEKEDGVNGLNWMPDGRVIYNSNVNGESSIWAVEANGGNSKQISKEGSRTTISPDGRFIIYVKGSAAAGDLGLRLMDISDGREKRLTSSVDTFHTFSPDGKWVVFTRFTERVGLWKVPGAGGEPMLILDENAICPAVSPDGKTVAFHLAASGRDEPYRARFV